MTIEGLERAQLAYDNATPEEYEDCAECGDPCRAGIGLCPPCLKDAEEAAHDGDREVWHDDSAGLL